MTKPAWYGSGMRSVTVQWAGARTFDGLDSKGQPVDIDGGQQLGAKPSDLLPMALAACSGYDVVELLTGWGCRLDALTIQASYIQDPAPPHPFKRIRLHYTLAGSGFDGHRVREALRLSEETMCSVAATLRGSVDLEFSFEILGG